MSKLLYVITEGIGNAVLALPAIEALRDAGHAVSVVGKYPALDIIPDEFRAYTLESLDTVNTPFDAVLLSPWSADYIAKYGRAPHIGECPVYEADPIDGTQHEALIHFDLAACIDGVEMPQSLSDIRLPKIPTDETGLKEIQEGNYVVFANCAAPLWDRKRWQGYSDLAHLIADEYHIVVLGGENDKKYYDPDYFPNTESHFNLPLRQVAAILDNAEWVVGNDCGLTHIASVLCPKTIALFGATSRVKNTPLGCFVGNPLDPISLTAFPQMACSPCQYEQWESVCQDAECMRIVKPETIAEYITGEVLNPSSLYRIKPPEQKQTLAAVIRVKDAIDTIEECLAAASRICDYFCIVDNGSTDGTQEYLRKFVARNPDKFIEYKHKQDLFSHIGGSFWCWCSGSIIGTAGYDEPRDRQVMDTLLKNSGATWGIFLDADEIVSDQLTREHVQEWMHQNTYNAIRFRHVHFWNDTEHYRTDQRWKPRHNRIMWRITPESTITTDKKIHPEIVRNLKGRVLDTDYVIKHYGHIDTEKNAKRAEFYRSIDNPTMPDFSGRTYQHMTDETELKLAKWDENTPIDARDFGNPSVMLVLMHGGGDMLMATPTIRALASQNPNLEISVMGLGKTQERDFKTGEFFKNNPCVHRYYDSSIDSHPVYWDAETFHNRDLPRLHKDLEQIQQLTRFDEIIITTLQSDYQKHKIDRFADACGVELSDRQMDAPRSKGGSDWVISILKDRNKKYETPPNPYPAISVHRWCGNANKSWEYTEYKTLVERLASNPEICLVLWDMGDPEPPITGKNIINMRDYVEEMTFSKSALMMAYCDLHIGADSLPMHLAAATDTPTLAIFEKTLVSVAAPLNDNAVIAASVYALGHSDPDFCVEHSERIATCGLEDVKAEHLYPILHKMGYLKDDVFQWYRTAEFNFNFMGRTVEAPASDHNDFESPDWKELKVAKALNAYVIPNQSVFLDVGANVGRFSLLIDKHIKAGIAVEPNPEIYKMLCRNFLEFMTPEDRGSFSFYNCALSDTNGTTALNWTARQSGASSIMVAGKGYLCVDVETRTLDSLTDSLTPAPDLIKIDVEGAELKVLKGGTQTLKNVRAIAIEMHGYENDAVLANLAEHGFRVRYLTAPTQFSPYHILATAPDAEMLPFPQNCLFDPTELLTVEHHERISFERPADIYKTLTEFDNDSTWWFEHLGIQALKLGYGDKRIGIYEGDAFLVAPTLMWFKQLRIRMIHEVDDRHSNSLKALCDKALIDPNAQFFFRVMDDTEPLDTLVLTNFLGYAPDADDRLFELIHTTQPKQLFVNFPFSVDGAPTRYRGRHVNPYTYETLDVLLGRLSKRGYSPVGDTDFRNTEITDARNAPHAGERVTRGRLLLEEQ